MAPADPRSAEAARSFGAAVRRVVASGVFEAESEKTAPEAVLGLASLFEDSVSRDAGHLKTLVEEFARKTRQAFLRSSQIP